MKNRKPGRPPTLKKFLFRISTGMHKALMKAAAEATIKEGSQVSMNELINRALRRAYDAP